MYCIYIIYIYIRQNISDIYSNATKIYFRFQMLYTSHIYFISMGAASLLEITLGKDCQLNLKVHRHC